MVIVVRCKLECDISVDSSVVVTRNKRIQLVAVDQNQISLAGSDRVEA